MCDVFDARTRVLVSGNSGPHLVGAAARGGGLGLLASADLFGVARTIRGPFGVRVSPGCGLPGAALVDSGAAVVLVDPGGEFPTTSVPVVAGVRSLPEAAAALEAGAAGLLATEDGELSGFVLLQQLLDTYGPGTPIWVAGTGPRTAAGVVAAGAFGVLLDEQLALLPEARTPATQRGRLSRSDTSLAPLFARRYPDAERAVRDVVAAVRERSATGPAEQGAPLCGTLGSTLPIVQGPMTRVSDQPEFAAAVAEHGGFPFVAVATASGPSTADLLRRTADLLSDRPWGAGLLGFLDADLVDRQLAEVKAARPRCALLAGGRVAQAKALEAAGIATYVHAPSPILLRQFLDAGLRRFVFEGAECGGHIGPRSSFVLWEQQLDVLRGAGPGLEIIFAGGVHDARSAALVAAMAAEQAAAGTGIGVLMGTAYLFTREAVETGAITDVFQDLLVRAASTVTLETAPGHRTRCLPSPYTDRFEAVRTELSATSGMPAQEVWQRLEDLNTGRLRIASKGLRRTDAGLTEVDATAQVSEGLYLAGQVTTLRTGTTTMAELHHQVTTGATNVLRARAERPKTSSDDRDIAIIGIACSFPGAADLPAFWSNILRGIDAVTDVPADRWDSDRYADASASRWGGFLPPLAFDPLSYGIPPASMGSIDPAQLVSLETARRALADAGYADREFDREHTSVIFGAEAGGDLANAAAFRSLLPTYLERVPEELLAQLPALTEDTFPGTLANVISGRIANRLDLRGANYTVDAACGSSLAALDVAVKELRQATSAMVLCGAVDLHNGINDYLMFTSAGALSPTGKCRPFDAAADGIVLGEGVACLVLKRLADAERHGDRVYAVVKGVGAASDGRALGLTAPRPEGQYRALTRAYVDARVSPSEVTMVEAHGTGTVVGDATELRTLTEFFTAAGAQPGAIALGSVKSQIGHTKCAAGLAGLIKAALALWHEVMPPTLNLVDPNTAWQAAVSPFCFATVARPTPGRRGLAGVSAFGFGGTNFHAVLAPGPVPPNREHGLRDWSSELILVKGTDLASARAGLTALAESDRPLRELAFMAASEGAGDPVQLAVVAESTVDLTDPTRAFTVAEHGQSGKVAFLFPGQGSQRAGMLAELFVHFPELADMLRLAPELVPVVFPPTAFDDATTDVQERAVTDTNVAQPALGLVEAALCALLCELGVTADFLAGHSFGELAALHAGGAFDLPTLLNLSRARAAAIAGAAGVRPGAMAAVRASLAEIAEDLSDPDVVLANNNGPKQVVVSGTEEAVGRLVARLRARGLAAKLIPVACAFHSPLVAPASDVFAADLEDTVIADPVLPVWSNRTGKRYATGTVRRELAAQIAAPVRFAEQIEDMYESGARIFVEVGPGRVLTRLTGDILGSRPHTAVSCEPGIRGLLGALGHLAVCGVPVDLERLFRGRVELTDPPSSYWTVDGRAVRAPDGTTPVNALAPARQIARIAMTESAPAGRDQVVAEFLRNSREFVAMQREVMLGYLGSPVPPAPTPRVIEPTPSVAEIPAARKDEPRPIAARPADDAVDVLGTVLAVISDRTGFPPDMIENGLDLEADLSIDSIKRTEIAGTLLSRLGLVGTAGDDAADLLVRERTVTGLAKRLRDWLAPAPTQQRLGLTPRRYRQRLTTAAFGATDPDRVRGKTIAVLHRDTAQDAVRDAIEARFSDAGATPVRGADADLVISLDALAEADDFCAPRVFEQVKAARGTFVAVALGDVAARRAGLAGLLRTAALERTAVTRLVIAASMTDIDKTLLDEVLSGDGPPVVHHLDSGRWTTTLIEDELGSIARAGAGPGTGELEALGLGPDSVVLFLGGAHGVAARAAVALAASRCRIELTGRTPWPMAGEDESLPDDSRAMRAALVAAGHPAREVEGRVRTVRAQREIGRTLDQIAAAGGDATYHTLDCRDGAAVRRLVADVHTRRGRIDGVVHAAGVIADRLMTGKDVDSFRNVFDTKVSAASALLAGLVDADIRPAFVAFFGSISALLGNRGQTDYAAANDALDLIGEQWHAATGGRTLTVHWGPWAPAAEHGGMVTPELAREYERRNVSMIDPDEATAALLRELAYGAPDVTSVLYAASLW